jgi:DNA modification methylase
VAKTIWPEVSYATLGGTIIVPAMECCLGAESTPEAFVGHLVLVFRDVRRVLRKDGTLWLNLGDSYATQPGKGSNVPQTKWKANTYPENAAHRSLDLGVAPKNLLGIPWMVAFALRYDGWWLRQDIIWNKPNPMPESVKDRCCKAHEYLFLLAKSARYYFNAEAIQEDAATAVKNLQQVREGETCGKVQQEQPEEGRANGGVQGVSVGDAEGVGQEVQSERKSKSSGLPLLLLREGGDNEEGIPGEVCPDSGATGALQRSVADARERTEIQSPTEKVRCQPEGGGYEGEAGSPIRAHGQGQVFQTQDEREEKLPDQGERMHLDAPAVVGDQSTLRESLCLLQPSAGAFGDGPRGSAVEGGSAHGGEHRPCVPDMQCQKGRGGRSSFRGQGHYRCGSGPANRAGREMKSIGVGPKRNKRSVWTITPKPFKGAHFATFPPDLVEPCILAGSRPGDTVLDIYLGSGTTGMVALQHGREFIGCELKPEYMAIAAARIGCPNPCTPPAPFLLE